MTSKYFKKVDFWAREFRLPLFWLTDKRHKIMGNNTLMLYKNSVIHAYHLDDREIKASKEGYKFFTNKKNVREYENQIKEIRNGIKNINKEYTNVKMDKLSDTELKSGFLNLLGFLNSYSNLYTKTEPFVLSKIEADEVKNKDLIKKLGESRFILRKEGEALFYNLFGVLLEEVAKRLKLKMSDLFFYTHNEMLNLFKGKKPKEDIIKKRKRGYALISVKNQKILLTGEKFKKLYREIVLLKSKVKQLTGVVAMKGGAKGRVRVILHNKRIITKEVAQFKKGEILVTEMTRPDTVLACKKAAAIVTDEGGITSHAAIISRELKIPCIVATRIATQVLKTGDLVEVDAINKGVVSIIEKK